MRPSPTTQANIRPQPREEIIGLLTPAPKMERLVGKVAQPMQALKSLFKILKLAGLQTV
jgi:hypothetical protein